jgi:prolyl-tRNA editing enzyme YbaK/EbsC (Cys-tRNA(Pro) deacylase)
VVREATGYAIGGVPPLGLATQMRIFVDPDLLQYDEVWAAAGTWNDVFAIKPDSLVLSTGGLIADLKRNG